MHAPPPLYLNPASSKPKLRVSLRAAAAAKQHTFTQQLLTKNATLSIQTHMLRSFLPPTTHPRYQEVFACLAYMATVGHLSGTQDHTCHLAALAATCDSEGWEKNQSSRIISEACIDTLQALKKNQSPDVAP